MSVRTAFAAVFGGLVLVAAAGAAGVPLASLSDPFDDAGTVSEWQVIEGDLQDGVAPRFDIDETTDGELTIVPGRSWWVNRDRAFALMKPVVGDFVATTRIRISGKTNAFPTANWSLSGLLVRRPVSDRARENWLAFRVGRVDGVDVFERKTTVNGTSALALSARPGGWLELRVARVGPQFVFLYRAPGGKWKHHWTYQRGDLPAKLTVGIDAFSGYDDTGADLVSHVDSLTFASTRVPGPLRRAVVAGKKPVRALLPYLTR
ncbi:MAG TPA: hypothetical protein VM049_01050 [Gaiellaceae bacterium]|nr:hypothetical protein [Gaiellaceae bacterium]